MGREKKKKQCWARKVDMIESQAISLRIDAWECWYEMSDLEFPSGWGTDLWFHEYCVESKRIPTNRKNMAVIDKYVAINREFSTTMQGNHKEFELLRAQVSTWKKQRGITFSTYEHFKKDRLNKNIHGKCLLLSTY